EDGIRDRTVTGVQTCALPIWVHRARISSLWRWHLERRRRWLLPSSDPEPGATNSRHLGSARPHARVRLCVLLGDAEFRSGPGKLDRKSTRLNSSHRTISYAVF